MVDKVTVGVGSKQVIDKEFAVRVALGIPESATISTVACAAVEAVEQPVKVLVTDTV